MIKIFKEGNKICLKFQGENFNRIKDGVKLLKGGHFDADGKQWVLKKSKLPIVLDLLKKIEPVVVEGDLNCEKEDEIEPIEPPIKFDQSLLKYPPLKGKPPYENYQIEDIEKALSQTRYGLFLTMRTGKTYIMAGIYTHLKKYKNVNKALIISSGIGCLNIKHEFLKFIDIKEDEIFTAYSADDLKNIENFFTKNVIITNYSTFRILCDRYCQKHHKKLKTLRKPILPIQKWLENEDGVLFLDESHFIGNYQSQQTKAVLIHSEFFKYRYLFTGTPADKYEKLYTQLKILGENCVKYYNYYEWLGYYADIGNKYSMYAINFWKSDKIAELKTEMKKYSVFRGEECLNLSNNIIKKIYLDITDQHREIYRSFVKTQLINLKTERGFIIPHYLMKEFPFLHMSLDCPPLLLKHSDVLSDDIIEKIENFDVKKHSKKIKITQEIIKENVEEYGWQGIVWYIHPLTGKILQEVLHSYNPLIITAEHSSLERDEIIKKFKENQKHKILISSIYILNTSINLSNANYQIYVERPYKYVDYIQSMKRIYSSQNDNKVITYILIYNKTIDLLLDKNLEVKNNILESLSRKTSFNKVQLETIFEPQSEGALDNLLFNLNKEETNGYY